MLIRSQTEVFGTPERRRHLCRQASTHIIEDPYLELVAGGFHMRVCEYACCAIRLGKDTGMLKPLNLLVIPSSETVPISWCLCYQLEITRAHMVVNNNRSLAVIEKYLDVI